MDMQHGRLIPGALATVIGAALLGTYWAYIGFDADIGHSATLLALAIGVFVLPGCAGAVFIDLRARRSQRAAKAVIVVAAADIALPFPAAEAVADLRSLTEARVERRHRARRAHARHARQALTVG
ncbi:MAG: hypothetical protein ABI881_14090 [Betaproteobacteria bacterium]